MTDADSRERTSPLPRPWAVATAAAVLLALVTTLTIGVGIAGTERGQTPLQSYILSVILTVLAIAAGWIGTVITEQMRAGVRALNNENDKRTLDQTAEGATQRIFLSLRAMAFIQEISRATGKDQGTAQQRLARCADIAEISFTNLGHSVDDWKRIAPKVVDDALAEAAKPKQHREADANSKSTEEEVRD
ncbi:hypothetical protein [Gordonia terrae]|uniref:hypothetical protein n=1 Tax=Gordonia terrae TaxID=2055 RepID=UPI0012691760|nr:hypothetical protein [Gordonia terrae]